jgi:hypothetical protein
MTLRLQTMSSIITSPAFAKAIRNLLKTNAANFGLVADKAVRYGSEGNYSGYDWKADPTGQALREQASAGGRPDLPARLGSLRNASISYFYKRILSRTAAIKTCA